MLYSPRGWSIWKQNYLRDELEKINELVYHLNPSLRTFVSVTQDDLDWVYERYIFYKSENASMFTPLFLQNDNVSPNSLCVS